MRCWKCFVPLWKSPNGGHDTPHTGQGIERTQNTKNYTFLAIRLQILILRNHVFKMHRSDR